MKETLLMSVLPTEVSLEHNLSCISPWTQNQNHNMAWVELNNYTHCVFYCVDLHVSGSLSVFSVSQFTLNTAH